MTSDRNEKWERLMKEAIVKGVIDVITQDGAAGLTMNRVAREADVSKATVYAYFDGKAELIEATVQAALTPLRESIDSVLAADRPPEETLRSLVATHLRFFDENQRTFRVLLYEREKALGKWSQYRRSRHRSYAESIAGVIQRGIDAGDFRPLPALPVAMMLVDALISVNHERLFGESTTPVDEDVALVVTLFFNGLKPDSGP